MPIRCRWATGSSRHPGDFWNDGPVQPAVDLETRRAEIRRWLEDHPTPTGAELASAGYVAPHWPEPWGLGAPADHQLLIEAELSAHGVELPDNPIGIGWAGPTLLHAGTPDQQRRWLPGLLSGGEFWCQLFSEPGAGSDLASLSTVARLDGDTWIVSGQKIWTTWAERARWGILLARTDPTASKHHGISYFVCPMDAPGIDVRPITEMSGGRHFTEVFFDDVAIPADHLIGVVDDGWRLARVTLGNERVSLSTGGVLWGMGPTSDEFWRIIRTTGGIADPILRQRFASVHIDAFLLELHGRRILETALAGAEPGPEASLKKLLADEHGQRLTELARDLTGAASMLSGPDAVGPNGTPNDQPWGDWCWAYLFARALTIGGGTTQVQRNILAERVLGLPRET